MTFGRRQLVEHLPLVQILYRPFKVQIAGRIQRTVQKDVDFSMCANKSLEEGEFIVKKRFIITATVFALSVLLTFPNGYARNSIGSDVDNYCAPRGVTPFGGDCTLCHSNSTNFDHALSGDFDWFCPLPACTDGDGDGFSVEGGDCGPVDCNDSDPAVNPGAVENCTDGFDNNCNGLVDIQDPAAVGCPPICTDNDYDGYALEGGDCGAIDCDDGDPLINPGAAEICSDGLDNNCNSAIDENCGPVCTDSDGDGFSIEGGDCGPVDCNDSDPVVNPGANEICDDGLDNNCNSAIDENCGSVCTDSDGDGFFVEGGNCGDIDCDDSNAATFPGAVENCSDGIDNNCNGLVDTLDAEVCIQPPTCTDYDGDGFALEGGDCGPVDCDDNDAYNNPGSVEFCGDAEDNDCDGTVDEGCDTTCPDADGDSFMDAACGGNDCNDADAAINPARSEICGNGIDENCNGMSDDPCDPSPEDPFLVISRASYDAREEKLSVAGRANAGVTITITDADSGKLLIGEIQTLRGRWQITLRHLEESPERIRVATSDGIAVEQKVSVRKDKLQKNHKEGTSDRDRDDEDHDDSDDERSHR